ncbi:MAG: YtxH domain-containing protein, partial [Candidatus Binatia bacterium]
RGSDPPGTVGAMNIFDRLRDEITAAVRDRGNTMTLEDILQALPSRNDMAGVIGLQQRRTMTQDATAVLGLFGTGLLVGAGLALLFAPKPGQDLRRDIAEKVSAGVDAADRYAQSSTEQELDA